MSTYPTSDPITFVLIHGAWHDGDSWKSVQQYLEAAGHTVHAPTIPFTDAVGKTIHSLDQAVQSLLDYIEENKLEQFVLVGHSWGGIVITDMATKLPEGKIKRIVYHNAFIPAEGNCLFDLCPPFAKIFYEGIAAQSDDNTFDVPFPVFREAFMNDADIHTSEAAHKTLRRQPMGLWVDQVKNTESFYAMPPKIPRSVVFADGDCTVPFGSYESQAVKLGIYRFIRMSGGGHEVIFTDPEGLAKALIAGGRD
ncbi:hypothetical protein H072_2346 [Dactylellina haptotyla CBS 200.50]|uniref:AB hydrolase-1 domain-containing protein n=1 Tax=Dactylellina haptotyla (strain CBS 200.50) TaxID=1284197 RepID=S8AKX6_DACHA|nr:hypothetical protein H072_2346 [Dactylellina haptotyla CBS 200.50]